MKSEPTPARGRPSRRPQIVAAAETLIRTQGLAHATTRAIALEAGCSEAALYVHFENRLQLLLAVLEESLPEMLRPLQSLESSVGKATPARNLLKAFLAIFAFHQRVVPMLCSLFSDPELLAAYRSSLAHRRKGPKGAIARLQRYIVAEQNLGRIDNKLDAELAATTLMATSFFKSFTSQFFGEPAPSTAALRKIVTSSIRKA